MFQRRRLTWGNGKTASPPPSTPSVGNVLEPSHPATQPDPDKDSAKTGDPGDWGDTPTSGPYDNGVPPSTPGYDEAGAEHPAAKKAAEEAALMDGLKRRAQKAIKIVEACAAPDADPAAMKTAAMNIMELPEEKIDAAGQLLTKLGFFTAMDDDDMDDDAMSQLAELEEAVEAMKQQMGMGDLGDMMGGGHKGDDLIVDESPGDDIGDPNTFMGMGDEGMGDEMSMMPMMSSDPEIQAMYQAMVQEDAMSHMAKDDDKDEDDKDDKEDHLFQKKKAALEGQIKALKKAMDDMEDDDSEEAKEAKKAAAETLKSSLKRLAALAAEKNNEPSPLERLKAATEAAAKIAADDEDNGDEDNGNGNGDEDNGDDDGDDDKEAKKAAAAAAAAAAEAQGTSPDDAIVLDNAHQAAVDPMGLTAGEGDTPMVGNDSILSLLYKNSSEDEEAEEDEGDEEASKKAHQQRAASTRPRPQAPAPKTGIDALGTLTRTASEGTPGADVQKLSSIWQSKPDVSDHFQ